VSLVLLSGCAAGSSDPAPQIVTPDLPQYSAPVQDRAADEVQAINEPACNPRQQSDLSECSALKLFLLDYLRLRDQVRSAAPEPASQAGGD
jgi:Tfp pilus assembly protein PilP